MSAEEFAALLTLATAMSFTPGPNTTLSAALAANFGMARTLRFVVAVPAGWLIMMLACGLGLGALMLAVPALSGVIKGLGVAYLGWLAFKLARVRRLGDIGTAQLEVGFLQGVGLQFLNIKAWMLALALAAGWVTTAAGQPTPNPNERLAIVCAVMTVFALASNLAYAALGAMLREWLSQGTRLTWFNRGMALALLATAVWMLRA